MRRFYLLLASLIVLCALLLRFSFRYSGTTVAYHLLLMAAVQAVVYALLRGAFLLFGRKAIFRPFLHTLLFADLLALIQLYLLIIGSNYFWKKTITLLVMKNYFQKFSGFIDSLPIEPWIFYAGYLLVLAACAGLYLWARPRTGKLLPRWESLRTTQHNRRFAFGILTLLVLAAIAHRPLLRLKRIMQFGEEPVLQFAFGNLWGSGNEVAFDRQRYALGERDKACYDSLGVKPLAPDHTVVVILLDALRADHLPAYGYPRKNTPFLDSLLGTGQLFPVQHAFSTSTNTVGGVAAMFYSRDWESFGYTGLNLMKYLKGAGYTTHAYLTGYHRDWFGLSALYRASSNYYYESPKDPDVPPDDDLVTLDAIEKAQIGKRSFVYIHLLSTHTIGRKHAAFRRFLPDKIGIGTDERTALINNYDNGILQADFVLRRIFGKLQRDGLLENSTVFLLADHGELFGEGGQWSHGGSVHPSLLSIPMLIWDRSKGWYNNLESATLKDVAPTIVDRLGYPLPACWEGVSLHAPKHDFRLPVNAVAACDLPLGLLQRRDGRFLLDVFDAKKQLRQQWELSNGMWRQR